MLDNMSPSFWIQNEIRHLEDEYHRRMNHGDYHGATKVMQEIERLNREYQEKYQWGNTYIKPMDIDYVHINPREYLNLLEDEEPLPQPKKKTKKTIKKVVSKKDLKRLEDLLGAI